MDFVIKNQQNFHTFIPPLPRFGSMIWNAVEGTSLKPYYLFTLEKIDYNELQWNKL